MWRTGDPQAVLYPRQPGVPELETYMKNLAKSFNEKNASPPEPITDVSLISVPLFFGGRHRGCGMGPEAVRAAGLDEQLEIGGFDIVSDVLVPVPPSNCWKVGPVDGVRCAEEIYAVCLRTAQEVEAGLERGSIPITIGGDHSVAIGSISGASSFYRKQDKKLGLIWFDAHGDIHTPETSYNGNLHAMPLAVVLGKGHKKLVDLAGAGAKVEGGNSVLIGLSDLDGAERDNIKELGVTAFTMHDIDRLGIGKVVELAIEIAGAGTEAIHVSFDIDVMDSEHAPGVGTPSYGGMHVREAHHALTLLSETKKVCSVDMVEINPAFDVRNRTAQLAVALLRSVLGQRTLKA